MNTSIKLNRWKIYVTIILMILAIPAVAMQFTSEVNWSIADFIVAGILLSAACVGLEWILRTVANKRHRWLWIAGLVVLFVLIWAELAVGVFGTLIAGS